MISDSYKLKDIMIASSCPEVTTKNTVDIEDIFGKTVKAEVGDIIATTRSNGKLVIGNIERIKNGFQACGMKFPPHLKDCVWLSKR